MIGYHLSGEEHRPTTLVSNAQQAERSGFGFLTVSDHIHPWVPSQGHSPFVWGVIGGVAAVTSDVEVMTAVTCPTMRMHPVNVAHAAATAASMLGGRFVLGLGSGENLNEHVTGNRWPSPPERLEMLEEAIGVIRLLWEGGNRSHRGTHFTVDRARIYTLPDEPPPIAVAAGGPKSASMAGRCADALVGVAASENLVEAFVKAGGSEGHRYGKVDLCWAPTEAEAVRTAHQAWPNAGFPGATITELALPEHFQDLAEMVEPEDVSGAVVCGPDPDAVVDEVRRYTEAGFDRVVLHQIGPDQEGFFRFWESELRSRLT